MKRLLIAISILIFLIGGTMWVLKGDPENQSTLVKKIKLVSKIKKLKPVAEAGDMKAQYELAGYYEHGQGVPPDKGVAAYWYKKAAEQGHVPSQFSLGKFYESGEGLKQDFFAASKWYRLAASFGHHRDAQFNLAQMYFKGRGVDHDYGKAIIFYRQAALQGHPVAQFILGAMYEEGWGVTKDYITAYTWYKMAEPNSEETIAVNRNYNPTRALEKIKSRMNRYQIEEAEKIILKNTKRP
ncbi:MAG: sel1 repeat family protein [Rhodospirillaceae bacterium]|nr:sel1 repeat family protein [Rhodospirillaceae bacterium]